MNIFHFMINNHFTFYIENYMNIEYEYFSLYDVHPSLHDK